MKKKIRRRRINEKEKIGEKLIPPEEEKLDTDPRPQITLEANKASTYITPSIRKHFTKPV